MLFVVGDSLKGGQTSARKGSCLIDSRLHVCLFGLQYCFGLPKAIVGCTEPLNLPLVYLLFCSPSLTLIGTRRGCAESLGRIPHLKRHGGVVVMRLQGVVYVWLENPEGLE